MSPLLQKEPCPDGGIGRRAGLKHQWSNPCRFDPGSGYELQIKGQAGDLNIRERAIKKFKRKFDKTGVIKELRRRQQFDKPSEIKRVKMQHAKYVQQLHAHDDM